MLIVKFIGGLGNQMFQYAFYKSLEKENKVVKADISGFKDYNLHNGFELDKIFNIDLKYASNEVNEYIIHDKQYVKKLVRKTFKKYAKHLVFNDNVFYNEVYKYEDKYLEGYWQNIRYFSKLTDKIKRDFTFKTELDKKNKLYFDEAKNDPNSVSIHIRRGDYLTGVNQKIYGGICTKEYYNNAIEFIKKNIINPKFYVFSNDFQWVKANFNLENKVYIDWNTKIDSYKDMQLMSACSNNIIANSTFSWWSAWLNSNENKIVIAPSKWTNDSNYNLSLEDWIKI